MPARGSCDATRTGRLAPVSTPRAAGEVGLGRLIDLDPTLAEGWTSGGDGSAIATARVPFVAVSPGRWSPDTLPSSVSRPFALLVADGLVLHQLHLADSVAAEILGPGDILTPDLEPDPLLPARRSFLVADAARIAILDARLIPVLAGAPVIGVRLVARAAEQFRRASAHRAIVALPRVEDRILALFGHLAERWGRVGAVGLVVPLALTHEGIGHLIGARRPTVSLGLKSLAEDDALDRRADGSWVLSQVALRRLAPAGGNGLPDAAAVALVRGTETVLRSHRPASPMVPSSREPERMTPTVPPP
jgi:CRP/FNR family cyclic AMP-dependent transcriptional regulator